MTGILVTEMNDVFDYLDLCYPSLLTKDDLIVSGEIASELSDTESYASFE
jgi:hypothetical protein